MKKIFWILALAASLGLFSGIQISAIAAPESQGSEAKSGLRDTTVLIVRHAEKPETGPGLSPAGEERAKAYIAYFSQFTLDGHPAPPDALFATADSKKSERPRRTLEPLANALHLKLNVSFKNADYAQLVGHLQEKPRGKTILIAWHHGEMPQLLNALGADAGQLLPGGKWPADEYDWLVELQFDHHGKLIPEKAKRIEEHLTGATAGNEPAKEKSENVSGGKGKWSQFSGSNRRPTVYKTVALPLS